MLARDGLAERERFELSVRFDGPMLSSISRTDDPGSRYCRSSGAHGPVLPEYFIAISRIPAAFALAPLALSWARAAIKRRSSCYLSQKGLDIGFNGAVLCVISGAGRALRSSPAGVVAVVGRWWCGVARKTEMEDLMAKSAKKPAPARSQGPITAAKPVAAGPKAAKPTSAASVPSGAAAKASDSIRSRTSQIPDRSNRAFFRCCDHPQGRRSQQ